jgi:60 kDa SS-A/Ro ribonucleoprotein
MAFSYVKNQQNKNVVPATKVLPGMAQNDGGGASYVIDKWSFFDRFLKIGAESGTYAVSQDKNQTRNCDNAIKCIKEDGSRAVAMIRGVSEQGLAAKNDSAIYALALCFTYGDLSTKLLAEQALSKVCRTGTHILMFSAFVKSLRSFGKVVARAVNSWYTDRDNMSLAMQLTKYQQREGWSHKDVFRLSHPKFGPEGPNSELARWVVKGDLPRGNSEGENFVKLIQECRGMTAKQIIPYIKQGKLQREHLDSNLLNEVEVQKAMLPNLGGTALLRNLGNMSKSGLLAGMSNETKFVYHKLTDKEFIKKSRLHPLQILVAQKTYSSGQSLKGSGTWPVNNYIVDALEKALELSFDSVEPTNQNYFFGLDISGSMSWDFGTSVSCAEVTAVMSLTFAKVEPWTFVGGFSSNFVDLGITRRDSYASAMKKVSDKTFGSTNPGAAIEYAINHKMDVDKFVFITDNDCNSGSNPAKLLKEYRRVMKKPQTKMIVFGLTASNFSLADPTDPLMLDCAGFTPDMTSLIQNF